MQNMKLSEFFARRAKEDYGYQGDQPSDFVEFLNQEFEVEIDIAEKVAWGEIQNISPAKIEEICEFFDVDPNLLALIKADVSDEIYWEMIERLKESLGEEISEESGLNFIQDQENPEAIFLDLLELANYPDQDEYFYEEEEDSELEKILFVASSFNQKDKEKLLDFALNMLREQNQEQIIERQEIRDKIDASTFKALDILSTSEKGILNIHDLASLVGLSSHDFENLILNATNQLNGLTIDGNRLIMEANLRSGWLDALHDEESHSD
jgi:hypothetical protein